MVSVDFISYKCQAPPRAFAPKQFLSTPQLGKVLQYWGIHKLHWQDKVKFLFSNKATKIDEIFTIDLTFCSKSQIHGKDFVNFMAFLENMNFR